MSPAPRTGAEIVCNTLERLGVQVVFGVPGTQTMGLYDALRRSSIRAVLATHELGAAFMANGYFRASGRVGVLSTIPGPGFTNALTGLAEARADSAAVLLLTVRPAQSPGRRFQLQSVDQAAIAGPLVKRVFDVHRTEGIAGVVAEAHDLALSGEPGPVVVQFSSEALSEAEQEEGAAATMADRAYSATDVALLRQVAARLAAAQRPVLLVGQGAAGDAEGLRMLVEKCALPVLTTPSGRGVIPEDHPFALGFDPHRGDVAAANALLGAADLILAIGCKLAHNGTVGFGLSLPPDRLVHVNADAQALGANYPAALCVTAPAGVLFAYLLGAPASQASSASAWTAAEVGGWRERLQAPASGGLPEPAVHGVVGETAAAFFGALRRALPRDGVVVTDSGLHQVLTRRHFEVLAPRGLLMPTDFQSMGFGVPAAIGAKLAAPERPVVAVVGDGGLLMSGMELVTAVRERVPLTVVVFNDGQLNQIRLQQYREYGHAHSVALGTPDLETFAAALGLSYVRLIGDAEATLRSVIASRHPTLVEVEIGDSPTIRLLQAKNLARATLRGLLGARVWRWLKRALERAARK